MLVKYHKQFSKDIDKIGDKKYKKALLDFIQLLKEKNDFHQISGLLKLKGYKDAYRFRVGTIRVGLKKKVK